jgi:hypothetical protein
MPTAKVESEPKFFTVLLLTDKVDRCQACTDRQRLLTAA